jgi:hypothetical protein
MRTHERLHQEERTRRRFEWAIGTPYFIQGTSNLAYVPILYFIKFTLGMGDAGGQLFDALRTSGWLVKPIWGFLSDRIPLFGYHLTFLASILTYTWIVNHFPSLTWYHYLYTMVVLGMVSFPLSFYLYLDLTHPWWRLFEFEFPAYLNPLPGWNRYQWFRLITQMILGFASIPAFIIPLTIAGQTVQVQHAGVSYAFLMSLSNVTDTLEGVVGAGLYQLFSQPGMGWLLEVFRGSLFAVAKTADTRTLILQMFVYISLFFTLLTIPFIILLRRELQRQGIPIKLGKSEAASAIHG